MANIEYSIWISQNGGKPYCLSPYRSFNEAYNSLEIMIKEVQDRHQPYYVDNDFFKNEYPAMIKCRMFCIKKREVSEWQKYSYIENLNTYNNVYQFPNFF